MTKRNRWHGVDKGRCDNYIGNSDTDGTNVNAKTLFINDPSRATFSQDALCGGGSEPDEYRPRLLSPETLASLESFEQRK